jgi:hypothetical protein
MRNILVIIKILLSENMGIFDGIKRAFGRKKETIPEPSPELEPIPLTKPTELATPETLTIKEPLPSREPLRPPEPYRTVEERAEITNVRAKLDLLLTEIDSIKTQNQMINERLKAIEKTLGEIRGIRYY